MIKSKLYNNLVDATNRIVNQFGKSIIQEDRFVNILSDMCPDRDNPAVFRIIRSAIQDDLIKNVLFSDFKNIENQIATVSYALSKRYGYDLSLVEGIMFSLAVGYGTISKAQYTDLSCPKNKTNHKNVLPPWNKNNNQNNNQNKNKPKNNTNPTKKNKFDVHIVKYVLTLIWGILGLSVSPFLYLFGVISSDSICFVGSFYVAILHFFTLVPIAAVIDGKPSISNQKTYPSIAGAMYGLMLCAITFWVVFPVLFGFQFILDIWDISIKEPIPWITTFIANLFCAAILGSYLEEIERFSSIPTKGKNKYLFINIQLFNSKPFKRGFIIVTSYFLIVGFISLIAPTVSEIVGKYNIYRINSYIDELNKQKADIKLQRENDNRKLGFAQFNLDDSFVSAVSKIKKDDVFTVENSTTYNKSLSVHNENYISLVDSIISLDTQWNNEIITIELFFVKNKLAALRYSPLQTKGDSILSIYTAKYGEPEYELKKYVYSKDGYPKTMPAENSVEKFNISSGNIDKDELYPDSYYWTYKNCLIKIDYKRNINTYFYEYSEYRNRATITYFSRKMESVLKRKKEMEVAIQNKINKMRNDSIKRVREIERRKQKEEERRIQKQKQQEELNHKLSIEQI